MKAFLDTNIYISHYRAGLHQEFLHRVNAEYTLYLHAVVLSELYAGACTPLFQRELKRLEKVFASRGRIIIPQKRDYVATGEILRKMGERGIFTDALLASSARYEGMMLITEDRDFERIKKIKSIKYRIMDWKAPEPAIYFILSEGM